MKNLTSSPLPRRNHFKNTMFWQFLCALLFMGQANAQVCQLPEGVECTLNEPSAFKVITTSKTFSQMIADGELLPQATSGNTPQFLIVCQTITHDLFGFYAFGAGSEIVFLNNSSGIVINGNNSNYLRFNSTYLHGCQKLWNGIRVKGGVLEFRPFCRIEDALTAVHLEPNSQLIAETTTFDGNYTCIFAGGAGNPNQHSITTSINGNDFCGQKPLIENYAPNPQAPSCFYSKPMYGIVAQNVQHLNMVAWGGHTNHFRDFSASWSCSVFNPAAPTGILAQNSSLTVSDVAFRNIANGSGGKGVNFVVTPGAASMLDLTGRGKNGFFTFENVQTGIYGLGNMTVRASHFNNLERGIYLTGNPGPYTVTVTGNSFVNVDDHTVFADQISPINRLVVQDNDFNDNDLSSGGLNAFPRSGVHIRSFTPGQQNSWIFNNTFLNSPKAGAFTFGNRGVWIRNLNGSLIEQNQFTDNFGSTAQPYEGVSVFNASTRIWSNNFAGAGNWGVHPSAATQVQESPSCWLNCNYANQTKLGWEFQGMNSDAAKLEKNIANAHDKGLLMRTDAVIGNQNNKYNRWIGAGSNTEAQFEGRNPGVPGDLAFVQLSRFRIHTPNMVTDFWPNPRLFGNVVDPGQWFIPGSPAIVECIATAIVGGGETLAPSTTEADMRVIAGTYQPVKGYAAGLWEAKIRLYSRLSEYSELRPVASAEANWYAAQQNTTVGSLGTVYQGILSLSRYSAQEQADLNDAADAQQSAAQAVTDKDGQIASNLDNPAVMVQLIAERQQLEVPLAAAIEANQSVLGNLRNAKLSAAQQQLSQLSTIGTSVSYETDFKTVCRVLLETYASESGVSEANRQTLSSIAHQCRYEAGFAVLQARASLGDEWGWEQYDNCPDAGARDSKGTTTNVLSLYPNPAKEAALLEMGHTVATGRATLRDLSGRSLQEWALDGQRQTWLRWGELPAGLYLLEVATDRAAPQMLKLAIERN